MVTKQVFFLYLYQLISEYKSTNDGENNHGTKSEDRNESDIVENVRNSVISTQSNYL